MKVRAAMSACVVLLGYLASPRGTAAQGSLLALFEEYVESLRQQAGIPGLSAAIVQDGRVVWEKGFGFQDLEDRVPALPDTPYPIADLTQTLASTIVLRCAEERELSLDDPIQKWTSRIPESAATVRHVLAHASDGSPGSRYKYDGERFAALTPVVDACAGEPYRKALAEAILDRLGMRDTVPGRDVADDADSRALFDHDTLERYEGVLRRLATPYQVDRRGNPGRSDYPPKGIDASTGLISTVRDLARFDAALDDHVLLGRETLALAWTNAVSSGGGRLPTGLGWFVQAYHGQQVVWHFGVWPGSFSSLIVKLPGRNLTLILLANSDGLSAPFPLASGDITTSLFARVFLQLFA